MGWVVSLDVILSEGSKQSESWFWTRCIAQTSIRLPIPSSIKFRAVELLLPFTIGKAWDLHACSGVTPYIFSTERSRLSLLWEETLHSGYSPLMALGIRNTCLTSYAGVTRWWVPSSLCHSVCQHSHLAPCQCELLIPSDWQVSKPVISHIHQEDVKGRRMHVHLHRGACCNAVTWAWLKAPSLELLQLRKFRKITFC